MQNNAIEYVRSWTSTPTNTGSSSTEAANLSMRADFLNMSGLPQFQVTSTPKSSPTDSSSIVIFVPGFMWFGVHQAQKLSPTFDAPCEIRTWSFGDFGRDCSSKQGGRQIGLRRPDVRQRVVVLDTTALWSVEILSRIHLERSATRLEKKLPTEKCITLMISLREKGSFVQSASANRA